MTTLAIHQCLDRATALLRARVIFFGGAFSFVLSLKCLHVFFVLFFSLSLVTVNKFSDI